MKKTVSVLLLLVLLIGVFSVSAGAADDFSKTLAAFPDSYKASLTALHQAHPSWTFEKEEVGKNFADCLNAEHNCQSKLNLVEVDSEKDAKACQSDCKNAKYHTLVDGVYRCASYDYIAECMDPTNYLRETLLFQFEFLEAKSYYTTDKLETAFAAASSFMYKRTYKTDAKTYYYSKIILDAAKANNVDALFIISRITNEVGSASPAKLAIGYAYEYEKGKTKTVYNFFNIGGNVSASAKYAYNHDWTNPKAALEGGIAFIAKNYVKAGQYTNYYQKFQVNPKANYGFYEHQYMQGVDAVINESSYTYNSYSKLGILDKPRTFRIPVYNNLEKVSYEAQDISFKNASISTKYAYVNKQVTSILKVRTEPSTQTGKVLYEIPRSTLLQVTGKSGIWYKVKMLTGTYKGKTGYCHGDYVSPAQKLKVPKESTLTLQPKLRISTCSYAAAYNQVKGAVTISTKGVASGVKIGTVVFKATSSAGHVGFLEMECVGLVAAPAFSVTAGNKKASVTWKAVSDAVSYRVYAYDTAAKKYTKLAETTALSFTQKGLKEGTTYTYLVRSVDVNGFCSAYTTASNQSAVTIPPKPNWSYKANSDSIVLSWSKAAGAQKYGVWRYDTAAKKYTKLANTTAASYTVTGLKANTQYAFLVRAYNDSGWSPYTTADNTSFYTAPTAPKVTAAGGAAQVALSWTKSKGASYYCIYLYNSAKKTYQKAARTADLKWTAVKLADGTQYSWLVRAYHACGAASSYTTADLASATTLCAKPAVGISAVTDKVVLQWSKVKGAQKYGIWRYDAAAKKYTKLANTGETTYQIDSLKANTQYTFLVRAHNGIGWSKYSSADNKSITTAPEKPTLSARSAQAGIDLSWNSPAGAVKYKIYSYHAASGKYTLLASVKGTSYTHVIPPDGQAHAYLVRAVNAAGCLSSYTKQDIVEIIY